MDLDPPLADRMRPRCLDELLGQEHLLAPGKPLRAAIETGHLHSLVLWGPPGTGKTTLARLMADCANAQFIGLAAVLAGVKDVRQAVDKARQARREQHLRTILFVDEVHRFNKAQQDAFLPHLEDGTLILVGATTENPSFALTNALLSRVRIYRLRSLSAAAIAKIIVHALADEERGLGGRNLQMDEESLALLAGVADGDARRALVMLEIAADMVDDCGGSMRAALAEATSERNRRFDRQGDIFYDQISALHKSVRGSHPDGALYWFARMLDGGCDPRYIARRLLRIASEDVGNADPRALRIALDAWETYERLGSPEGELAIAQALVYLACAAKSNAVYLAYQQVCQDVQASGSLPVPHHLRNAPTELMKEMGWGKHYRYAHDEPGAYAAGENYFPEELGERSYYHPVSRGLEIKIGEKLAHLREMDRRERDRRQR